MPGMWLKDKDGKVVHLNLGCGRSKLLVCKFCSSKYRQDEGKLCDFPVGEGRTCDAQMCRKCARTLGSQETEFGAGMKRLGDTIDVCPIHREMAQVENGKWIGAK